MITRSRRTAGLRSILMVFVVSPEVMTANIVSSRHKILCTESNVIRV